jgi:hypothetical protein
MYRAVQAGMHARAKQSAQTGGRTRKLLLRFLWFLRRHGVFVIRWQLHFRSFDESDPEVRGPRHDPLLQILNVVSPLGLVPGPDKTPR